MVFSNSEEKDRFGQPFPCSSPVTMKVTTTRKGRSSEVGCESLRISHCTPNWSPSIPPALDAFCMETLDEKYSPIESFCFDGADGPDVFLAMHDVEFERKIDSESFPDVVAGGA